MLDLIQTDILRAGGYRIYRYMVILENTRLPNYEAKKVKERLRHNLKEKG